MFSPLWDRVVPVPAGTRTVGQLLREHRITHDLTLEQLAERSGVSDRAISDIERGVSRRPRAHTVQLLCTALGLGVDETAQVLEAAREGRERSAQAGLRRLPLPTVVRHFVGRLLETSYLVDALRADRPGPSPVAVVTGAPGIGKTALAVHSANALAQAYDATYFLDLRALQARPFDPHRALRHLVRAARPDLTTVPRELDAVRSLWDQTFERRRILLVLDDARDEAHVRPLLPAAGRGAVVVTSRRSLAGLDGVRRLDLSVLAERESVDLLRRILEDVGPGQSPDVSPQDLATLAMLCEHTPLALRVAGSRIAARRGATVADLIRRLQSRDRRLAVLTAGDWRLSAVLEPSYAQLSPDARTLLRRLGATEGTTFCPSLAAVLLEADLWVAEDAVDDLVEVGFARPAGGGRFVMHGLVKLYASALPADGRGSAAERADAAAHARDWLQFERRDGARDEVQLG